LIGSLQDGCSMSIDVVTRTTASVCGHLSNSNCGMSGGLLDPGTPDN
jgi:hypothetical protein